MFAQPWQSATASGSLTKPVWARRIEAQLIGAGGGGGGSNAANTGGGGGGGGGGGAAWGVYDVSGTSSILVNLGAGGLGSAGNGTAGGNSSLVVVGTTVLTVLGAGPGFGYASGPAGAAPGWTRRWRF